MATQKSQGQDVQRGPSLLDTVLPVPRNAPIDVGNMGICDPDYHGERQGAELWRYSKALFTFTNTGGASLDLTAATEVDAFVAGDAEAGQGFPAAQKLSLSETDADKQGAMIKLNDLFEVRGLGVEFLTPYAYSADGAGLVQQYQNWILDGGYLDMLLRALYDNAALSIQFEDSACDFDLGLARFHPPHASVMDSAAAGSPSRNSVGMISIAPVRPFITGARDQINKAVIAATTNAPISVLSNPAVPLPAANVVSAIVVPMLVIAYGEKVCPPKQCADQICDTPQAQANLFAQFQMFQQMMANGGK